MLRLLWMVDRDIRTKTAVISTKYTLTDVAAWPFPLHPLTLHHYMDSVNDVKQIEIILQLSQSFMSRFAFTAKQWDTLVSIKLIDWREVLMVHNVMGFSCWKLYIITSLSYKRLFFCCGIFIVLKHDCRISFVERCSFTRHTRSVLSSRVVPLRSISIA